LETNSYAPSADDGEAKRTPSAWTISINLHPRLARAKPAPKRALGVVTFNEHKWVILRERQSARRYSNEEALLKHTLQELQDGPLATHRKLA